MDVEEEELHSIYLWVDEIPLSRPKRNIARDFADGVLMAEIVHHYFPKLVEPHNYSAAHGLAQKMYNWCTLNQKVFKRLGFLVAKNECQACAKCQPGAIERVLKLVRLRLARFAEGPGVLFSGSVALSDEQHSHRGSLDDFPDISRGAAKYQHGSGLTNESSSIEAGAAAADGSADRDAAMKELEDASKILETKVKKLEQLVALKDKKIQTLTAKLNAAGLS